MTATAAQDAHLIRTDAIECRMWIWATSHGLIDYGGRHAWARRADAETAAAGVGRQVNIER